MLCVADADDNNNDDDDDDDDSERSSANQVHEFLCLPLWKERARARNTF